MTKTLYKSLILVSAIFSFGFTLHAQDFWEALNTPNGIAIRSIAINDAGQIFLGVGNNNTPGGVYRSEDAGDTWDLVFDNGDFSVYPVEINPDGDIYIGKGGFDPLKVSFDNGNIWDSLAYPGTGNFTAMYSPGQDTLFVGSAYLVRTYDNASTWDTIFSSENETEYIKDILQTQSGDMYIALTGYFPDMGGVYKSTDGGNNWELSGLFNYMVSSLAENSEGDVFAGARGILQSGLWPGLYVLRNGEDEWEGLLGGPSIEDVIVNSADHIYASSSQVIRSLDNGQSFEYFEEGLFPGPKGDMTKDELDYLYVTSEFSSNALYRTINTTVSIAEGFPNSSTQPLIIYPNPVREYLFFLNMPEDHSNNYYLRVYNCMGSLIMQDQYKHRMFNVGALKSGYYLIIVNSNNEMRYGRFLKQ